MQHEARSWVLPGHVNVERGRDSYLRENGFRVDEYNAPWTTVHYGPLTLRVPNTKRRRWAIALHDLHHVATGFGTDLVGEGEVSAWELRRGLGMLGPYVGAIVCWGAVAGLVLAPRRTWRAWQASGSAPSLFHEPYGDYNTLLQMDIASLRAALGVPSDGLAHERPRHHTGAPLAAS